MRPVSAMADAGRDDGCALFLHADSR